MMDNCTGGSLLQIGQSDNTIDKKMLKIPGSRIQSDTAAGSLVVQSVSFFSPSDSIFSIGLN